MDDLLSEFLTETAESLEVVDAQLVVFEANPNERAVLDNIFRLVHTIKGTCGFLGLPRLEALAHAGETLLGKFRDGALAVSPEAVTLVLQSIDRIKELLSHLGLVGVEPEGKDDDLIGRLEAMSEGRIAAAPPSVAAKTPVASRKPAPAPVVERSADEANALGDEGPFDPELGRNLRPGEVSMAELEAAFQAACSEVGEPEPELEPVPAALAAVADDGEFAKGEVMAAGQSIRVGMDVLENLMTTVSELVLTRNQLLQMVRRLDDSEFKAPLQRLSVITGELQESVMKTRMQPIGAAWKKLPRIVRDVSQDVGKKIDPRHGGREHRARPPGPGADQGPAHPHGAQQRDHGLEDTPAGARGQAGHRRHPPVRLPRGRLHRHPDRGRRSGAQHRPHPEKAVANNLVSAGGGGHARATPRSTASSSPRLLDRRSR
jgi:two-component system chemotaxis sensor kinase CheA